jgi:MoaA/NifB/PqqE/SkfB family radical SAM enzyme
MSHTFCPLPWNHIGIQQNGDLRQCCQMIEPPFGKLLDDGKAARFDPDMMEAYRNHPATKALRKAMMDGERPSACNLCWKEEDIGVHSLRQIMSEKYAMDSMIDHTSPDGSIDTEGVPLEYIDLRLGNLCNLKCRSCSPSDSTLWVDDYAEMYKTSETEATMPFYGSQTYDLIKKGSWKINSNDFNWHDEPTFHQWLDDRLSDGLTRFYFTGGEPTINKSHMKILQRIIEIGKAKEITLSYNSNMIAIPPKLLVTWKSFKHVEIGISIDAIGDLAHYVRHPSVWKVIERNCDSIGYDQIPGLTASITSTVSVLNIRHFIDLTKWLISKQYTSIIQYPQWHLLHGPEYLSIQVLPDHVKDMIAAEYEYFYSWVKETRGRREAQAIRDGFEGIIRFMRQESHVEMLPVLEHKTRKLDQIRGERLADALPWLDDVLRTRSA